MPEVHTVAYTSLDPFGFLDAHHKWVEESAGDPADSYKGLNLDHYENHPGEDGLALAEFAGRGCYLSFHNPAGRTNEEYIENIKEQRHFSVLEHVHVSFYIEGADRAFSHELIRHRHFNYSELSQRYVDRGEAEIVVPPLYRTDPTLREQFLKVTHNAQLAYRELVALSSKRQPGLKRKQIREAARRVLPEATETRILVTGNLRSWLDMLEKRYSVAADASILEVSELILKKLQDLYPVVFRDVELQTY